MNKGINRSITGVFLSALLGTTYSLPTTAQTNSLTNIRIDPSKTSKPSSSTQPIQAADAYTLGAGDILRIDSFDTPELVLEPRYSVLLDGSVNLPWIGSVSVREMTLAQAAKELTSRYSRFIRNPIITVSLIAPRPLKIGVIGEVNRPGSYIISVINNESTLAGLTQRTTGTEGGSQWPTVSRAIQAAGGISQLANVRRIQVRRPQPLSDKEDLISVDLWKFLQSGDLSQDMLLRDGDTVIIPLARNLDAAEATQVAGSNFSPETIKVSVAGEVAAPGSVAIRPNSTLNQAILTAGGFAKGRARSTVELIRLNPNGTVDRRSIKVDLSQGLNEQTNPALRNNDIIVVNRNTMTGISDFLGNTLGPFVGIFGLFK
jgi:polysaccharide export outer membrane protein